VADKRARASQFLDSTGTGVSAGSGSVLALMGETLKVQSENMGDIARSSNLNLESNNFQSRSLLDQTAFENDSLIANTKNKVRALKTQSTLDLINSSVKVADSGNVAYKAIKNSNNNQYNNQ
jgi:hypothetical protein